MTTTTSHDPLSWITQMDAMARFGAPALVDPAEKRPPTHAIIAEARGLSGIPERGERFRVIGWAAVSQWIDESRAFGVSRFGKDGAPTWGILDRKCLWPIPGASTPAMV